MAKWSAESAFLWTTKQRQSTRTVSTSPGSLTPGSRQLTVSADPMHGDWLRERPGKGSRAAGFSPCATHPYRIFAFLRSPMLDWARTPRAFSVPVRRRTTQCHRLGNTLTFSTLPMDLRRSLLRQAEIPTSHYRLFWGYSSLDYSDSRGRVERHDPCPNQPDSE